MAEILETNVPKMSSESYLERYFLLEIFRQFGALQISPLKNCAGLHKDMLLAFTGTKEKKYTTDSDDANYDSDDDDVLCVIFQ